MRNTPVGRRHCRISRNIPPQSFVQTEQPSIERFSYFVRCSPCDSWVEILPGRLSVPAQTIPQLPGQPSQENAPVSKRKNQIIVLQVFHLICLLEFLLRMLRISQLSINWCSGQTIPLLPGRPSRENTPGPKTNQNHGFSSLISPFR